MHAEVVRWVRSPAAARATLVGVGVAGAAWWIAVAASDDVRRWTLGDWPAAWLAVPDRASHHRSVGTQVRNRWRRTS